MCNSPSRRRTPREARFAVTLDAGAVPNTSFAAVAGSIVTVAEGVAVRPDEVAVNVIDPAVVTLTAENVAVPDDPVASVVPLRLPSPAVFWSVTTIVLFVVTVLPNSSRASTVNVANEAPAVAEVGGAVANTSFVAVAGLIVTVFDCTLARPVAEASTRIVSTVV